jgi:hypothetical protein
VTGALVAAGISAVYVLLAALCRAAARGDEQLADIDSPTDPEPAWDEHWVDVWPTDDLTDAEVERRFARIVGWVQ